MSLLDLPRNGSKGTDSLLRLLSRTVACTYSETGFIGHLRRPLDGTEESHSHHYQPRSRCCIFFGLPYLETVVGELDETRDTHCVTSEDFRFSINRRAVDIKSANSIRKVFYFVTRRTRNCATRHSIR